MKMCFLILIIITLASCVRKAVDKKSDRFYFLHACSPDTTFIDKPSFDTAKLTMIAREEFDNAKDRTFAGQVIKLSNEPAPTDGGHVYYLTPDLGIIYSKSTTWPCYNCLHSTNDSIEKRINRYLEYILSKPDLVIKGEVPPVVKVVNFIPPKVKDK